MPVDFDCLIAFHCKPETGGADYAWKAAHRFDALLRPLTTRRGDGCPHLDDGLGRHDKGEAAWSTRERPVTCMNCLGGRAALKWMSKQSVHFFRT